MQLKRLNFITDGGKVDLSSTTLSFCRGVSAFVQDGLKLYIPEVTCSFMEYLELQIIVLFVCCLCSCMVF